MKDFSLFLIAFGGGCGLIGWFLYQKSLSKLIQHIRTSHNDLWSNLGSPEDNIVPYRSILNTNLREFIFQKKYETYSDFFINKQGDLVRYRILFCMFCLGCLLLGLVLFLVSESLG